MGQPASRKWCRRPAEPCRIVPRRAVVRGLSRMRRKFHVRFLGERVTATPLSYPALRTPGGITAFLTPRLPSPPAPQSFGVRVRHEVAGGIVTRRCHQLFCQLYPTGTCVPGNGEVRSSRDNVSSSFGMVVKARADTTTASIKAVGDQDRVARSTQVKRRKRRHIGQAKDADRLGPKGMWSGCAAPNSAHADVAPPA